MPSWNIHLEAGNRLAKKLKLSPKKRKEFLLGCLLPDINNGYINHAEIVKDHEETHYTFDKKSSLNFYAENQSEIDNKNPIFLGYLFHLFTDGFFNYNFYRNIKRHAKYKDLEKDEKRKIKHHDFWLYDTKFWHYIGIENNEEAQQLAKLANKITAVEITASDLENIEKILKNGELRSRMENETYLYYTETELDELLNALLEEFSSQYLGEKHA